MMGSTYPCEKLPPADGERIFGNVKEAFKEADMVFGNLEGPLTDGGEPVKPQKENYFSFRTPERYATLLKNAGFNVMNIANNHSSDFGPAGVENTLKSLRSAGIKTTGGARIALLIIRGKRVVVAGFSFSWPDHPYSINNVEKAAEIVATLKQKNDIVVVSFHGGSEGNSALHLSGKNEFLFGENRGNVTGFSRAVIDAGADMVIGHGPHVPRALEVYNNKLIIYSLGNFLTYGRFNIKGTSGLGMILKARMDDETGNFIDGEIVPVKLVDGGIPEPDRERKTIGLVQKLTKEDIKNGTIIIANSGKIRLIPLCMHPEMAKVSPLDIFIRMVTGWKKGDRTPGFYQGCWFAPPPLK